MDTSRPREEDDDETPAEATEHDLLVVFRLSNRAVGRGQERDDLEQLGEQLGEAVEQAGVGEYDGSELGGGECTLFFCGPDADKLFAVLQPLLKRSPLARGATVVKQYGDQMDGDEPRRVTLRI